MNQNSAFTNIGKRAGITNAAALSTAPAYGAGATNPVLKATDGARASKRILVEAELTGAGSGNLVVTLWRGNPVRESVSIADDEALAGAWTVAYAGAAKTVSMIVDSEGLDLGVTASVDAANISVDLHFTAIYEG
jgi:hypothetical protein